MGITITIPSGGKEKESPPALNENAVLPDGFLKEPIDELDYAFRRGLVKHSSHGATNRDHARPIPIPAPLPSSTQSQRALLGVLVQYSCDCLLDAQELGVTEDCFEGPERTLYHEIIHASKQLRPFDNLALEEHFRNSGRKDWEALGTLITDCMAINGVVRKIPDYAKTLVETKARRDVFLASENLLTEIKQGGDGWLEALQKLRDIEISEPARNLPRPLIDFSDTEPDPSKTLLGNRFLCTEGGMLFVGPSGIGKTSASAQQDLLWSVGLRAFGITPSKPLKILTIQAEDDDGDLSEIVKGVKSGLGFTPAQIEKSRENCFYVCEKSHTGIEFLVKVVRPLLKKHRPDILRINPFHAYLGGEIKDSALTAQFLRNTLNPLLAEFQCACILVHHTPKVTFRDSTAWKASDWMYAGAGAADITNWCRAALVIDSTTNHLVFRFIAAKRASRIGWVNELGDREYIRHFAHDDNGSIFWRDALESEVEEITSAHGDDHAEERTLELIPPLPLEIFRGDVPELARQLNPRIGKNRAKEMVSRLIRKNAIEVIQKPRSGTRAADYLRRLE